MKEFVIFVLLFAVLRQGDTRRVCILFEQKVVSTTTTEPVSVTISENSTDAREDIEITLGETAETTEQIAEVTADAAVTEIIPNVTESVSLASNLTESISTNICALEAITLFDDQHDLLRKVCTIKTGASSLYVITVQNSVVKSDLTLATLCSEGPKGLLSWISWHDFIEKVKPFLNFDEIPPLVIRNSSIVGPDESENNVDPFSEVLIEMLPIRYKLVNTKPSAWSNNTFIRTVLLGTVELQNSENAAKHIEGDITYSFPIETNITFLSSYPITGLSVEMSDEPDGKKNFVIGSGTSYIFSNTFSVERQVPAFKRETVSLKGSFGIHEYDITGNIISIFGVNTDGSTIEESHLISARVVSSETYDIKDTYDLEDHTTTTTEDNRPTIPEELPISIPHVSQPVYPGFRKFFYVAVVLVLGTILIASVDIVRKLRNDRKAKKQGNRTYQKIAPKI